MAQSAAESKLTNKELSLRVISECGVSLDMFFHVIDFIKKNPEILPNLGLIELKYYKALQHIIKEQGKLTQEATEALIYNLGL